MPAEKLKTIISKEEVSALQRWLNVVRLIGVSVVGVSLFIMDKLGVLPFDVRPIIYGIIPAFLVLAGIWFLLNKKIVSLTLLHLQLFFDLFAITAGLYFSGGVHSNFIFFYIIILISASLVSFWSTIGTGLTAMLMYALLIMGENRGVFTAVADGQQMGFQDADVVRVGVFSALAIVSAFQSYYLISRIRLKERELDKERDSFLFQTVHDLRSPVNNIRLLADKYQDATNLPPEAQEDARLVIKISQSMLRLIKDLLSVGKREKVGIVINKETVDVRPIIHSVIVKIRPAATDKQIQINYSPSADLPATLADRERLDEVFSNLIDNAIKYNKDGGSVTISHKTENGKIATVISDTGIGIDKESIRKLFTPYYRAVGREIDGTGLGLYIVKTLVEKMDGKIEVASELGKGSTFTVSLPKST